jgi:thymidylate synthase
VRAGHALDTTGGTQHESNMHVIKARNVNDAYVEGIKVLSNYGVREDSRNGPVLVAPWPVTTVYNRPNERILWDAARNANPFFHLAESLWMLAGRNDARWLDQFVGDFSTRFAEFNGVQHGAYGYRWRAHFDVEWGGGAPLDQLDVVVAMLKRDPTTRQAVIQMWDPMSDLDKRKKDIPCNTNIYLRARNGYLDMTVCCRSNDLVWGAYGANAVHFSILLEYLAARTGLQIGFYYQVSNNFHMYEATAKEPASEIDLYKRGVTPSPLFDVPEAIDTDLALFFEHWPLHILAPQEIKNRCLRQAYDLLKFYKGRDDVRREHVDMWLANSEWDWDLATARWLDRRLAKKEKV